MPLVGWPVLTWISMRTPSLSSDVIPTQSSSVLLLTVCPILAAICPRIPIIIISPFTYADVLVLVDHRLGEIHDIRLDDPLASPSPMPIPTCSIVATQEYFEPAKGFVTFGSTSNIAGREGGTYRWVVVMLSQCGINGPGTCGTLELFLI